MWPTLNAAPQFYRLCMVYGVLHRGIVVHLRQGACALGCLSEQYVQQGEVVGAAHHDFEGVHDLHSTGTRPAHHSSGCSTVNAEFGMQGGAGGVYHSLHTLHGAMAYPAHHMPHTSHAGGAPVPP